MGLRHHTLLRIIQHLHMGRGVGGPEGVEDGADGGFVVAAGFFEAGKVVRAQKELTSGVHGVKIQRGIAAEP